MKSNYYEHLAWFEHSVKPNVVTSSDSSTRCWHATRKKRVEPFNPTVNIDTVHSTPILTNGRKRRRIDSDDDDEQEEIQVSIEEKAAEENNNNKKQKQQEIKATSTSVAVQTSPLLTGIERTNSMETVYYDACEDLSLDENDDNNPQHDELDKLIYDKLNSEFNATGFLPNQYEAISSTLKNEHVLLVLPSGPYRDLCYLLPSIMTSQQIKRRRNGKTFVLYPSEDLLPHTDHYHQIPKRIVLTDNNNQATPWISMDQLYDQLCHHDIKIVYMTIQAFSKHTPTIQALYQQNLISRLVIEDAHCLSARSQGLFKTSFPLSMSEIRSLYPDVPIMALTSIPFETVHSDIVDALSIQHCKIYKRSLLL